MEFGFNARLIILIIASVAALALGAMASVLSATALPMFFPADSYITVISVIIFTFGFLFFGYPAPFILFLAGLFIGNYAKTAGADMFAIMSSIAFIMASYSSIRLGDALLDDMIGKGNFKQALKISIIMIILSLVISAGVDLGR
jgi:hypothetical protein